MYACDDQQSNQLIQPQESTYQRMLWLLNVTLMGLTLFTHHDHKSHIFKLVIISLIPLILQMYHISESHKMTLSKSISIKNISIIVSIAAIVLGTGFLFFIIFSYIQSRIYEESHNNKIWAPAVIVQTWHLMYIIEYLWQVIGLMGSLLQNFYYICTQHKSQCSEQLVKIPAAFEMGQRRMEQYERQKPYHS